VKIVALPPPGGRLQRGIWREMPDLDPGQVPALMRALIEFNIAEA
jgi:hypothetical protein